MGIVIKKCSDSVKYHIVHDLSWPPRVNDHINPDLYHCIYASFDQAVSLIKKQGWVPSWPSWTYLMPLSTF